MSDDTSGGCRDLGRDDLRLQPAPVCPSCGHRHHDAWEWALGGAIDGSGEHDCDSCGETFEVDRIVTVDYTTRRIVEQPGVKP